jgi:drug/metabolite transporter (DMT)-like permease
MDIPLSIILSICVALMNTAAFYLQKRGQNEIEEGLPLIKYLFKAIKTPKWIIGLLLNLATYPIYIYAISIGYISITQPLANTGIILLVVIGFKYLKEVIGKQEIAGVIMLVGGIFLIAFSSPPSNITYNPLIGELLDFFIKIGTIFDIAVILILFKLKTKKIKIIYTISK